MKHFLENRIGLVMILACAAGLVLPGLPSLPDISVIAALAALTFISCYKFRDGDFKSIRIHDLALFYMARFMALPFALWWVTRQFMPEWAMAVFLLSVLPTAVASPAFVSIFGGTLAGAFALVVLSQVLAPVLIPLQFAWLGDVQAVPLPGYLFDTLAWCIVVPMIVYALVRKHRKTTDYFYARHTFLSLALSAFVIAAAVARQRDIILTDPAGLAAPLLIAVACYVCYALFGWAASFTRPRGERIAYMTCSGLNNFALGVSLALLHFPPPVVSLIAVSAIAWSLLPAIIRTFLHYVNEGP